MNKEDFDYLLNLVLASIPKMTEEQRETLGFNIWVLATELDIARRKNAEENTVRA